MADTDRNVVPEQETGSRQIDQLTRANDPLAQVLFHFVKLTSGTVALDTLLSGLPLKDGLLTPALLQRALERNGYKTAVERRPLRRFFNINLPAILFISDTDAIIALKRDGDVLSIFDPQTGTEHQVSLKELGESYSGSCLLARKSSTQTGQDGVQRDVSGHWFWGTVGRLWNTYYYVILAAAVINVIALASPLFVMNVYDRVLPNKAISTLWVLASGIIMALLFDFLLKSLRGKLIDVAGRRADVLLSSRIYEQVLGIKLDQKPPTTGSFASQLREFDSVREFFTSSTIASLTDMAFFAIFLVVIYLVGGVLAAIPALAALFLIIAGLLYQIPLKRAANKHSAETAQRHSALVETIAALETVKLVRAENHLLGIWEGLSALTARTVEQVRDITNSLGNLSAFVQQIVSVLTVVAGAHLFKEGQISMGAIVASSMLAGKAVAPLGQFAMVLARLQQSLSSLQQLNTVMAMDSEQRGKTAFLSSQIERTDIQFQNVTFAYAGSPNPVLSAFNVTILPGEKVGIIGKIGSGKTTVGRLLTKLYEPKEGAVLIGGVDLRQYPPQEVRRVVGMMSQDTDLFHGTLRANILMANPRATDAQLLAVSRMAGVEDFVKRHPSGFDLQVGERGQALSGGQRQSVALARLLIAEPRILYLDEPSSAMDVQSERVLIDQLRRSMTPEQTVIVSTHRYSMLDLVDRLIVINNGRVAADGPKEAVLEALKKQMQPKAPSVQQPVQISVQGKQL
jgi:ATP-binding cassette, subfamily C, bacterial LapB